MIFDQICKKLVYNFDQRIFYVGVNSKLKEKSGYRMGLSGKARDGRLTWYPNQELEFTISYGDRLIDGARALMLGSKIDLGGS